MKRFQKMNTGRAKKRPGISTASLPDIVFILLFFFMVSTAMKQADLKVKVEEPNANQAQKLTNRSEVRYIYIGQQNGKKGTDAPTLIQLNDAIYSVSDVAPFVKKEPEKTITSMKVDQETPMRTVRLVKTELQKAKAYRVNYATQAGDQD